jgi:hypothetical protein
MLKRLPGMISSALLLLAMSACAAFQGAGEVNPDDDSSITRAVRAEISRAPVRGAASISVDTTNGVVTLTGTLEDPAAVGDIVLVAEQVNGVRRVVSELDVREGASPAGQTGW